MNRLAEKLEAHVPGGYSPDGPAMSEPTAWATMALSLTGRNQAAERGAEWLANQQHIKGLVPTTDDVDAPGWPTSLAMLAWQQVDATRYNKRIDRGARWLLETEGKKNPPSQLVGHDPQLVGWSWAANTHSWLEPTAFATMALTAAGHKDHPRTREAVRLIVDRLLEAGGANYGNTMVLGNQLLPHLQPSAIVLWSLASQQADDPRIERTIKYIEHQLTFRTGCASLAYAILALTACRRRPANADDLLTEALARPTTAGNCHKLALLSLAAQPHPLFAEPVTP